MDRVSGWTGSLDGQGLWMDRVSVPPNEEDEDEGRGHR
jgi:hypothetical protein